MGCLPKLHTLLWPETAILKTTCQSHLISNNKVYFAIRASIAIFLTWLNIVSNFGYWRPINNTNNLPDHPSSITTEGIPYTLQYLTQWGIIVTFLFYFVATIDQAFYIKNNGTYYFKNLWRWSHVLFELAFTMELLIVILYWGVLRGTPTFLNISQHGLCLAAMYIDFVFNLIIFVNSHIFICILVGAVYLIVNVIVTLTYRPVYDVLTYKDGASYLFMFMALVCMVIQFYFGYWISNKFKVRYCLSQKTNSIDMDPIQESQLSDNPVFSLHNAMSHLSKQNSVTNP